MQVQRRQDGLLYGGSNTISVFGQRHDTVRNHTDLYPSLNVAFGLPSPSGRESSVIMSHLPQGVKAPPPHSSKFVVRQAPSEPSWSDSMPDDRYMPLHNQTSCIFFARQCHNNISAYKQKQRPCPFLSRESTCSRSQEGIVQDNNNRKEWAHTTPPRYALHPDHSSYPPHALYTPPFPAVSAWQRQSRSNGCCVKAIGDCSTVLYPWTNVRQERWEGNLAVEGHLPIWLVHATSISNVSSLWFQSVHRPVLSHRLQL